MLFYYCKRMISDRHTNWTSHNTARATMCPTHICYSLAGGLHHRSQDVNPENNDNYRSCCSDFAQSTGYKERVSTEQKHGLARMAKCLDIKITCNYPSRSVLESSWQDSWPCACLSTRRLGSLLTDRSTLYSID